MLTATSKMFVPTGKVVIKVTGTRYLAPEPIGPTERIETDRPGNQFELESEGNPMGNHCLFISVHVSHKGHAYFIVVHGSCVCALIDRA